jgi:hypothetical protein
LRVADELHLGKARLSILQRCLRALRSRQHAREGGLRFSRLRRRLITRRRQLLPMQNRNHQKSREEIELFRFADLDILGRLSQRTTSFITLASQRHQHTVGLVMLLGLQQICFVGMNSVQVEHLV